MKTFCPLPVDWLDYVDGERDQELDRHLDNCPSCAVLVRSLQLEPVPVPSVRWADEFRGRTEAVWQINPGGMPAFGEFWLAFGQTGTEERPEVGPDRRADGLLVLVVGDVFVEADTRWVPVVPVRTDVEDATETDYLLDSRENTLGHPWRLIFSEESPLPSESLFGRVGAITEAGHAPLRDALRAEGGLTRWGTAAGVSPGSRGTDTFWNSAIRQLRTPWLLHLADRDSEPTHQSAEESTSAQAPREDVSAGEVHWLRRETPRISHMAFAAQSTADSTAERWKLDEPFQIDGRLRLEWSTGRIYFRVESSGRQPGSRRVRLVARTGEVEPEEWRSDPFELVDGIEVPLAEGRFPADIAELGAEVVVP